ncbi:hypothetical protein DVR12_17155 [Chitinophaga silvatica]|uniref:Uncharacterized protein n=1 Tax=Chitinophaga silvatica TaxID=2282649 RepID=A0A3E1Y7L0_9BACT|nr:hypothetical protein [Chitinophaga silvatica]RFS21067.1 hypothetical protein DVR12_17155 [Chitinophaga silvatica]
MKYMLSLCLLAVLFVVAACQKEMSHAGTSNLGSNTGTAVGTLKNDNNNCLPANVVGTFTTGTPVSNDSYIEVSVNVAATGTYVISTNTVNGVFFSAKGTFYQTGIQKVRLIGSGTFIGVAEVPFTYTFNKASCTIGIPVAQGSNGNGGDPSPGGGTSVGAGQWSLTIDGKTYSGNNLQYTTVPNMPVASITGMSSDNKYVLILSIPLKDGKAVVGEYSTNSSAAVFGFSDVSGKFNYTNGSGENQEIKIKITSVNGTQVAGTFSGGAEDFINDKTVTVTNGQFKTK